MTYGREVFVAILAVSTMATVSDAAARHRRHPHHKTPAAQSAKGAPATVAKPSTAAQDKYETVKERLPDGSIVTRKVLVAPNVGGCLGCKPPK